MFGFALKTVDSRYSYLVVRRGATVVGKTRSLKSGRGDEVGEAAAGVVALGGAIVFIR